MTQTNKHNSSAIIDVIMIFIVGVLIMLRVCYSLNIAVAPHNFLPYQRPASFRVPSLLSCSYCVVVGAQMAKIK